MKLTDKKVKSVFLAAMAEGYAQSATPTIIPELPGAKAISYIRGHFRVLDCYMVGKSLAGKSAGTTTIWYKNEPVWTMHYGGWYLPEAIPFLKHCLCKAYVEKPSFYGGRGPVMVEGKEFTYTNRIEGNSTFYEFQGEERIVAIDSQLMGHHWYRGMSLI